VSPRWSVPANVNVIPTLQPLVIRFWQRPWFQITVLVLLLGITAFSLWLLAQLALHRKEQMLLERERARIAADIHDDLGSRVTQLVLHGEVTQSELAEESPVRPQLERICEEARQVLATMDEVLWAVNPERDTLRDFTAFVCCYAEEFLKPTQIQCRLEVEPEMPAAPLDLPLRRNLLMAIKETLNNAVKHSGAGELLLQIHRQGQKLHVVVQDNGKGFDAATARADRNGLSNMTRRMKELGGNCRIVSQPGAGCRTEFIIPLVRPRGSFWRWLARNGSKKA
jgi:signal transduction histidine kinase